MPSTPHRYFLAWPDASSSVRELDGTRWQTGMLPEIRYPLAVLAEADKCLRGQPLHFYFTKDPNHLPEYGPHVVAVLILEERCKIPAYARHIRAVIRNMQSTPLLGFTPGRHLSRLEAVLTFEYARDSLMHRVSRRRMQRFRAPVQAVGREPKIIHIPLGYHSQELLPFVPMRERRLDAFFSGDFQVTTATWDYRRYTSTSKIEARRQLWQSLEKLASEPEWKIERAEVSAERAAKVPAYASYSERMQQSRVCLAPRGSMAETYRMHEGLRAGCLVMCNPLPPLPFLAGAPVLVVEDWSELRAILHEYGRDWDRLEQIGHAGQQWWDEHCSERVVGKQVADSLN